MWAVGHQQAVDKDRFSAVSLFLHLNLTSTLTKKARLKAAVSKDVYNLTVKIPIATVHRCPLAVLSAASGLCVH